MKVGDKHLRLVFTSYSIIYIFMNYGPGNIPNTMGSDSSTSGQVPLLLPFFFSLLLSGKHFNGPWHSGLK